MTVDIISLPVYIRSSLSFVLFRRQRQRKWNSYFMGSTLQDAPSWRQKQFRQACGPAKKHGQSTLCADCFPYTLTGKQFQAKFEFDRKEASTISE